MSPPNSKAIEVAASRVQDGDLNYAFRIFGRPPRAAVRDCERSTDPALPQTLFIILGGGFKKGYVHGSTNAEGMAPDQDGCLPEDISATIISCLGLDPQQELITPSSRPIALFRDGQRVSKLLV